MPFSIICVLAAVYDAIRLCKSTNAPAAEDFWEDDNLLNDATERDVSLGCILPTVFLLIKGRLRVLALSVLSNISIITIGMLPLH